MWILECPSDIDIHSESCTTISMEADSNTLFISCHINQNTVTMQYVHASDMTDYSDSLDLSQYSQEVQLS